MKIIFVLLLLLFIPVSADALKQVAGHFYVDLEPGESTIIEWRLISDMTEPTPLYLFSSNEGNELLSFEKEIILEPFEKITIPVTITIPPDYQSDIYLEPRMHVQQRGEKNGAIVINIEMMKKVGITIGNPLEKISPEKKAQSEVKPIEIQPIEIQPEQEIEIVKEKSTFSINTQDKSLGGNPEPTPQCGSGTELVNGFCKVIKTEPESKGGGCLIATAAYGTELAPQVQFLREIRDNTVMSTASGVSFMTGFNQLYYSFSPTIADMERENPMFQEAVKVFITPMVSTLSIMTLAESGSEVEVLGLGISVIILNLGMYIAAPTLIGFKVHNQIKSRK